MADRATTPRRRPPHRSGATPDRCLFPHPSEGAGPTPEEADSRRDEGPPAWAPSPRPLPRAEEAPQSGASAAAEAAETRVGVLLPIPAGGPYDYRVPIATGPLEPGRIVRVPLGRRMLVGAVWGPGDPERLAADRLLPVAEVLPLPPLPLPLRRFVDWVAAYTLHPPGAVLRMVMSAPAALAPPPAATGWVRPLAADGRPLSPIGRLTPARRRVLAALDTAREDRRTHQNPGQDPGSPPPPTTAELARAAGVSPAVVTGLVRSGDLVAQPRPTPISAAEARRRAAADHLWAAAGGGRLPPGPPLSPHQTTAAEALCRQVGAGASVTLLDGVTGAGKTEVYFEAIAACLAQTRQVLVLLPEIALAAQWPDRFAHRFGAPPLSWHSQLGPGERKQVWQAVADGTAPVVVGARSALFLPFARLGLIIVDEEHDASFKQEDGVFYHARDMAVVRAHLDGVPLVLASATPSLETLENVRRGRYGVQVLPRRHGGASLPTVTLVDLRDSPPMKWAPHPAAPDDPTATTGQGARGPTPPGGLDDRPRLGWLSPPLVAAVRDTLAAGDQVLLYLNRRGYAPLVLCRTCGHRLTCPHCSAWLVAHRVWMDPDAAAAAALAIEPAGPAAGPGPVGGRRGVLRCHHCGHQRPWPPTCPACGAADSLAPCGPGVERLAEEARHRFPEACLAIAASDTVTGPAEARALARRITEGAVSLIVGTQIMAKGHHFPGLTLVGVVDGDLGLTGGDLRAAERTHQLLHQVAGRAGRAGRPGRVVIQTHDPGHPVMEALASGDRDRFLEAEAAERAALAMPPFGRLAALIVSSPDGDAARATAAALAAVAPSGPSVAVLGPAPAPLSLLRGRHRHRLLLKAGLDDRVQPLIRDWLARVAVPSRVRVQVDIDPMSFL